MNVFDIIGPVMIGPSSSHTAGAVRIGRVSNKLAQGRIPDSVEITLSGSFAETYRGHGTDRALLAGIMGYHSYSPEIRDAMLIAAEKGLDYKFICENLKGAHPNTARIRSFYGSAESVVQGASVGGGNILINEINGMKVHFTGENNTILIMHKDKPGVIANVTNLLHNKYEELYIANFSLSREKKGGDAILTVEIDTLPPEELVTDLCELDNVENAIMIRRI